MPWANRMALAQRTQMPWCSTAARAWSPDRGAPPEGEDRVVAPVDYRSPAFALAPEGDRLATSLPLGGFRIDRISTAEPELIAQAGRASIGALAWSTDGQRLATADSSGLVRLLDLAGSGCDPVPPATTSAVPPDTPVP